ncbi:MAG: aspartyl-tRNA amidotransferase subunit B [Candidatus Binatia bacterium]|nr:MAG: aspartyl-tRNA amidotransferase subunit B [Candidatus Binatia bacterium]
MPTETQLQADLQAAMKAGNKAKLSALRDVITAIKNLKVEKMVATLDEPDIIQLIRKEANKRAEAAEFARQANRPDLIEKNEQERAILESYLPRQLSAEELENAIRAIVQEIGSYQIGPIMSKLRERFAGQFDGKLASDLIKRLAQGS